MPIVYSIPTHHSFSIIIQRYIYTQACHYATHPHSWNTKGSKYILVESNYKVCVAKESWEGIQFTAYEWMMLWYTLRRLSVRLYMAMQNSQKIHPHSVCSVVVWIGVEPTYQSYYEIIRWRIPLLDGCDTW